jgi:serine-type D-Ala-D-Ala carboxypeptidase (penicillin-binding protein 5/6)
MRKSLKTLYVLFAALIVTVVSIIPNPISVHAAEIDIDAESAILVDAETGRILYEKNADVALPPASMTKMMTEYLVLEAINEGTISWDTTTQISDYAYWLSGHPDFSGIGLIQNKDYTVEQLYIGMAVNSDNATTVALAELISGSEGEFVKLMNEKAQELGLPDAQFVNSTGLHNSDLDGRHPEGTNPDGDNYLSAKSAALLAYHLINDYPEALKYSSMLEGQLDDQVFPNRNWMLPGNASEDITMEGVDGLKTGYTDLAQYCFTGTAERNGQRLISVVMGVEAEYNDNGSLKLGGEKKRFLETKKLLEYGFENFEVQEIFPAGYQLEDQAKLPVIKGKEKQVEIATAEPIRAIVKKGEENAYTPQLQIDESLLTKDGELTAPIKKGDVVGKMTIQYNGGEDYGYITDSLANQATVDVVAQDDVEKANWFSLMLRAIGDFFADLFTTIVNWIKGLF